MKKTSLILISVFVSTIFLNAQSDCLFINPNYSGFCSEKHKNGKTSWIKEYKEGKATGTWMYFNEKGELAKQLNTSLKKDSLNKIIIEQIVIEETYATNEAFSDDSWAYGDDNVNTIKGDEILTFVEEDAEFPGGLAKMNEWIAKKIVYPVDAEEMGLNGKCYVKFVVEKDGQISNVSVVRGVPDCPQCDKEAIRLVISMPHWKAGKNGGKAVRTWCQLPINFSLK